MSRDKFDSDLSAKLDQTLTLKSVAKNVKAGAVIITDNDEVMYIQGLTSWDDDIFNKEIIVIVEDGTISQGTVGLQFVLKDAEWELTSES